MKITSFNNDLLFNNERVQTSLIIETSFSKEIRILLKAGQIMKEHQTPFPIIIHVIKGKIVLGIEGENHTLQEGDILSLDGGVRHNLDAKENSIVRLSLSKHDQVERVNKVTKV